MSRKAPTWTPEEDAILKRLFEQAVAALPRRKRSAVWVRIKNKLWEPPE